MTTTSQAIDITNAIKLLAELFNETQQNYELSLCTLWEHRVEPLNEEIRLRKESDESDIIKRAGLLGLETHRTDGGGYRTEIVLSTEGE
ncbi:MAG: hypothetical protein ABIG69_20270 [Bacteroidota bacterium]